MPTKKFLHGASEARRRMSAGDAAAVPEETRRADPPPLTERDLDDLDRATREHEDDHCSSK